MRAWRIMTARQHLKHKSTGARRMGRPGRCRRSLGYGTRPLDPQAITRSTNVPEEASAIRRSLLNLSAP